MFERCMYFMKYFSIIDIKKGLFDMSSRNYVLFFQNCSEPISPLSGIRSSLLMTRPDATLHDLSNDTCVVKN